MGLKSKLIIQKMSLYQEARLTSMAASRNMSNKRPHGRASTSSPLVSYERRLPIGHCLALSFCHWEYMLSYYLIILDYKDEGVGCFRLVGIPFISVCLWHFCIVYPMVTEDNGYQFLDELFVINLWPIAVTNPAITRHQRNRKPRIPQ